jgi:hypothetical protein
MCRYRLEPTREQEAVLLGHCGHARYVWNLAVEQHAWWRPGRKSAPGYLEQCRQLTAARAANPWLAAGSQTVQQQALRDFAQAVSGFFAGTHRRPSWRKAGVNEGFRIVGRGVQWDLRVLNRKWAQVKVPKAVRARGPELAREPSAVPVHRLRLHAERRRECGQEYRGGARRESAGRRPGYGACEPRTSTRPPKGVAGIPRPQTREDVKPASCGPLPDVLNGTDM